MDVAAKRKDGTVDCTIVVSSRLEATTAHQQLLTEKIKNYLKDIHTPEFVREFEQPKLVRIVIFFAVPPSPKVLEVINKYKSWVKSNGAELVTDFSNQTKT